MIASSKICIINQKLPVGGSRNDDAKYTEGGGDDHLIYMETMELSKYTLYRILVPHNNGNANLTGVERKQVRPHKSQRRIRE